MIGIAKKLKKQVSELKSNCWCMYNKMLFRLKGAKVGNNLRVYNSFFLQIRNGSVSIGDNCVITSGEGINPLCRNLQGCLFVAKGGKVSIGDNVGMSSPCVWSENSITIGNNASIGGNCVIMDTDVHEMDFKARRGEKKDGVVKSSPVVIGDDVWLGNGVLVLKGVTIGDRTVVGAGSVVTKSLPADVVAAGNPCKVIRSLNDTETK